MPGEARRLLCYLWTFPSRSFERTEICNVKKSLWVPTVTVSPRGLAREVLHLLEVGNGMQDFRV